MQSEDGDHQPAGADGHGAGWDEGASSPGGSRNTEVSPQMAQGQAAGLEQLNSLDRILVTSFTWEY